MALYSLVKNLKIHKTEWNSSCQAQPQMDWSKELQTVYEEDEEWIYLYRFLLQYRITPHSTTGISPSEMLMAGVPDHV